VTESGLENPLTTRIDRTLHCDEFCALTLVFLSHIVEVHEGVSCVLHVFGRLRADHDTPRQGCGQQCRVRKPTPKEQRAGLQATYGIHFLREPDHGANLRASVLADAVQVRLGLEQID
jgi:hypothetical protein